MIILMLLFFLFLHRMAEEIWTLRVFKHDRGNGANIVVRRLHRQNISYANLQEIMKEESYRTCDDMFFSCGGSYSVGSLRKIEGETHATDMVEETRNTRKVDLHLFDNVESSFYELQVCSDSEQGDDEGQYSEESDDECDEEGEDGYEEGNDMHGGQSGYSKLQRCLL